MSSTNKLKELLSSNQGDRLSKEKSQQDRIADPNLLRHTTYKGDRTIQQLGQEPIENGVILNNQSLAIGDVMLPLAKGNVMRRVDNTNGGALLGTAYRDALENDYDANGNRRKASLSRNGGNELSDPTNPNRPKKKSDRVPSPFGCTPPPSQCFWSRNPIAPRGFQSHGDAVVNENGLVVYLHCVAGTNAPSNLNCGFLDPNPLTPVLWGINGTYSATFSGSSPSSYQAAFKVSSTTTPVVLSASIFNPNTSYPNLIYIASFISGSGCSAGIVPSSLQNPDGNQWFIATIQTNNSIFGVLIGGAAQSQPFISASWSNSSFYQCS